MAAMEACYLPPDRLLALAAGRGVPRTQYGAALYADISGFTPVTEHLRATLGARRGAEVLATHLNRVYDALIAQVEQYGGAVISFAGDAIICWFDGAQAAPRATACGVALLAVMPSVATITLPDRHTIDLALKVAVASGPVRRFVVGDPRIQLLDTLAGATVLRLAAAETLAKGGELLVDLPTLEHLDRSIAIRTWRGPTHERFAVVEPQRPPPGVPARPLDRPELPTSALRPWLLPAMADRVVDGLGEFPIELRPAVALFARFVGLDYDSDPQAEATLNALVCCVQRIVDAYAGTLVQLTIGEKGSFAYAAFGAPLVHEDDAARALNAALDIRAAAAALDDLAPVQIGISCGVMRTGAYGSTTRRTYGVLGDDVNLAARLMIQAAPGEILLSRSLRGVRLDAFALQTLPDVRVKGKAYPVGRLRLLGRHEPSFADRFYTTPLVGRDTELAELRAALQPLLTGRHAGVVYVTGEAGIGKSRLAHELREQLQRTAPVTWLTGQADGLNRAPLATFAYLLRPYFGQRPDYDDAANLAAFDAVFDGLLELVGAGGLSESSRYRSFLAGLVGIVIPGSPYAVADEKLRLDNMIAALQLWARAESRRQPVVLHLEDAQWLDAGSIRAVQQLTYNLEDSPLALLVSSRTGDDGTTATIPNIYSVPVTTVTLDRLSDANVLMVASAVLGGAVSAELVQFVGARTEGNPFFTEQLLLDLKERGAVNLAADVWELRPDATVEVPSGISAILIARLDRLMAQVKQVVQTGAVLGREFAGEVLARMLPEVQRPLIRTAADEAIWSALDTLRYLFRHALLRDAAYEMQAEERLQQLHRLAADTIEALYPADPAHHDALREHWGRAGAVEQMAHYTVLVCEPLVDVTADYERAERLLDRALAVAETVVRAPLLRLRGDVARLRGQYPAAMTSYRACLAVPEADGQQRTAALLGLATVGAAQGDYPGAAELAQQTLDLARASDDAGGVARALSTLGDIAFQQGQNATAHSYYTESLALYRVVDAPGGIMSALNSLGKIATLQSDNPTARTYLEESLALGETIGDRHRVAYVLNNLGNLALNRGDYPATRRYYERSLGIRRAIGDRNGIGAALGNLAILAIRQANLADARAYSVASLAERRAIGDRKGIASALSLMANIAFNEGDPAGTRQALEESLAIQREINDRWGMATSLFNLGELAREDGAYPTAQAYVAEALTLYRELGQPLDVAYALTAQASLAQLQGELTAARDLYEQALQIRREINEGRGLAHSLVYLAGLEFDVGAYDMAERRGAEALELLRQMEEWMLAPMLALMAAIRHARRQPVSAVLLLREALTLAHTKQAARVKRLTLVEAARLLAAQGRDEPLAEVIGLVLTQGASTEEKTRLNRHMDTLRGRLPASVLDAALQRGRALDLDTMLATLLADDTAAHGGKASTANL